VSAVCIRNISWVQVADGYCSASHRSAEAAARWPSTDGGRLSIRQSGCLLDRQVFLAPSELKQQLPHALQPVVLTLASAFI